MDLKRIIYCIKVIIKSGEKENTMYHVTYYYLVQAVSVDTPVELDETIYNKIQYPDTAIRYLDVTSTETIKVTDEDYPLYFFLAQNRGIEIFHTKKVVMYELNEVPS